MSYCTITTSNNKYTVQRHSTPPRGWNPAGECGKLSKVIGKSNVQPEGLQLKENERIQSIISTMESIREPLVEASSQNRQIAVIKDLGEQIKSINKLISEAHKAKEKIENKQKKVEKKEKEQEEKASLKMQTQQNKLQKKERKAEGKRVKEQEKEAEAKEKVVEKERKRHPVILGASKQQPVSKKEAFPFTFELKPNAMKPDLPSLLEDEDGGIGKIFSLLRREDGTLTERGKALANLIARYTAKAPEKIESLLRNMGDAWVELEPQIKGASNVFLIDNKEVAVSQSFIPKEGSLYLYTQDDCIIHHEALTMVREGAQILPVLPHILFFLQNVNVSEFMQTDPQRLASACYDADFTPEGKFENLEKLVKAGFTPFIEMTYSWAEGEFGPTRAKKYYEGNKKELQRLISAKRKIQLGGFAPFKKTALKATIYTALKLAAKYGILQGLFAQTEFKGEAVEKFEKNLLDLEKLIIKAALKKHDITHFVPLIIKYYESAINVTSKWIEIAESQDKSEEVLKKELMDTIFESHKEVAAEFIKVLQIVLKEISTNPEEPEIFNLLMSVIHKFRWLPDSHNFTRQIYKGVVLPFLDQLLAIAPTPARRETFAMHRRETASIRTGWTMGASRSSAKEKESENIDRT